MRATRTTNCSKMIRGLMPSAQGFFLANGDDTMAAKVERASGGSSRWTHASDSGVFPAKAQTPRVFARVEKARALSCGRIERSLLRALSQRAGGAGQGKVLRRRFSARIERDGMVNVKGRPLAFLCESATLAAAPRPLNYQSPQWSRNEHCLTRRAFSGVCRATEPRRWRRFTRACFQCPSRVRLDRQLT